MGPSRATVRRRQQTLNAFTNRYLKGVTPLREDGVIGHATRSRIMLVKYYLGYGKHRDTAWEAITVRRIRHPRKAKYFPEGMIATGIARRTKQKAQWAANHLHAIVTPGVTRFDGRTCAKWLVPYLQWARENGWRGQLVSGWRAPWYSTSLCVRMCGRPQCSGTCAGAASNHSGSAPPRGALDVSFYEEFAAIISRCPFQPRIFNDLPRDRVHFSATGR